MFTVNSLPLEGTSPEVTSNDRIASNHGFGNMQGNPHRGLPCCLLPTPLSTSQSPLSSSIAFSTTWNAQTVVDCPAYRSAPVRSPLPRRSIGTFYSGHTPTLRRLNHLADYQAPGTNPAASELPALAILSATRVSWLRGCYSSGRAWYVRRSRRQSFLYRQ